MNIPMFDDDPDAVARHARIADGFKALVKQLEATIPETALDRHRRAIAKGNTYWDARRPVTPNDPPDYQPSED